PTKENEGCAASRASLSIDGLCVNPTTENGTMKKEEVMNLPGSDNPVLCADGKLGMLLIYPGEDGLCGVQVHGEEEHRWISVEDLTATDGGALRQAGAPAMPPATAQSDMVQMMLAMDWASRGGC
ncbi:MAG: hypothetical protein ABIK08_08150, partial [Pseudomonadota bacterium]